MKRDQDEMTEIVRELTRQDVGVEVECHSHIVAER